MAKGIVQLQEISTVITHHEIVFHVFREINELLNNLYSNATFDFHALGALLRKERIGQEIVVCFVLLVYWISS